MISHKSLNGDGAIGHLLGGEMAGHPNEGEGASPRIEGLPEHLPEVAHGSAN